MLKQIIVTVVFIFTCSSVAFAECEVRQIELLDENDKVIGTDKIPFCDGVPVDPKAVPTPIPASTTSGTMLA